MLNFDPNQLQPYFRIADGTFAVAMATNGLTLVPADGSRVLLFIAVPSTGQVVVRPNAQPATGVGITININTNLQLDFATYGGLVQQTWLIFAPAVAVTVYFLTLRWTPPG